MLQPWRNPTVFWQILVDLRVQSEIDFSYYIEIDFESVEIN